MVGKRAAGGGLTAGAPGCVHPQGRTLTRTRRPRRPCRTRTTPRTVRTRPPPDPPLSPAPRPAACASPCLLFDLAPLPGICPNAAALQFSYEATPGFVNVQAGPPYPPTHPPYPRLSRLPLSALSHPSLPPLTSPELPPSRPQIAAANARNPATLHVNFFDSNQVPAPTHPCPPTPSTHPYPPLPAHTHTHTHPHPLPRR